MKMLRSIAEMLEVSKNSYLVSVALQNFAGDSLNLLNFNETVLKLAHSRDYNSQLSIDQSLAVVTSRNGNHNLALHKIKQVVHGYRQLEKKNSIQFMPLLAASLKDQVMIQSHLNLHSEALTTSIEAVNLYHQLEIRTPNRPSA